MASSRASSPASESLVPSPSQLTPRSKVKAMLASLDNGSDDESVSGSARARLVSAISKPRSSVNTEQPFGKERKETSPDEPEIGAKDDTEEEEDVFVPKGRMAGRLQANTDISDEDNQSQNNARERVKKLLTSKPKSTDPIMDAGSTENSDKEDALLVPRKRKIRVSHRSTPKSSPINHTTSPGLFVSPSARRSGGPPGDASDSDELPINPPSNDRFKALVEKKRQERLAKEAAMAEQKAKKEAERRRQTYLLEEDELDVSDDTVERRLTQQAKPTRKASKKALEEMHRETQRLSRNMQLAHEARTRKKITKASLFAKFNYKPVGLTEEDSAEHTQPTSSSPTPHSDFEMRETPPTSPASHGGDVEKSVVAVAEGFTTLGKTEGVENDEDIPTLESALTRLPSPARLDKGKGKAVEEVPDVIPIQEKKQTLFRQRPIRIRPPKIVDMTVSFLDDSDSDLEIVTAKTPTAKKQVDSVFDRVPAKQATESRSLHALRMLAHLTSPGKQSLGSNKKPSMTSNELQVSLQQRARQQATREREERLQALRDRGVIIQTAEEREKEMAEVEDLISKARREGEEIMRKEKAEAKKGRRDRGEVDPIGDSSDDEEWVADKEKLTEEISGSGSEDDEPEISENDGSDVSGEDDELLDNEEPESAAALPLFDNEAEESDEDEAEADLSIDEEDAADADVDEDDEEEPLPVNSKQRITRISNVISDDEDEDEDHHSKQSPLAPRTDSPMQRTDSPMAPNSVLRSATKTFIPGVTVAGPAGLGLTQIFAGTMDDSQIETFEASPMAVHPYSQKPPTNPAESFSFLRRVPEPELPAFVPTMEDDSQDVVVDSQSRLSHIPESQMMDSMTQGIQLQFSQSQIHGFDSLVQDPLDTQISEFPEATQDVGFQHMTPIAGRFVEAPPSTVETVIMGSGSLRETLEETPTVKKKGKLRRRAQVTTFSNDDEGAPAEMDVEEEDEFDISANVFDVMRKASKKKELIVDEFDKKKSKAKEMVHEQAEESEDEYAGLGGASDDESVGEEDAFVKEMIDDEAGKEVDESKLAAFFADRERANDEKQVEKLYNDITKGMLRRKRGADYDLSDSDDGGEARQRMKRKEFAKMRKALLADERIGKIAENPKKQAFLRAIEDRRSEDEMDFLDDIVEKGEASDSQSQSQGEGSQQLVPDSQTSIVMGPPKRKRSDDDAAYIENRPPPHLRRTKQFEKPSNLTEIRQSLSSLIEEPNAMTTSADSGTDSDDELEIEGEVNVSSRKRKDKENRDPFALRRKGVPVIDRISLKRASSSSVSTSTRLAFAAPSSMAGFKVPPLLRRATTNSSLVSGSSSTNSSVTGVTSATERMAGGPGTEGIKRGGGKNSGVHYFARESERKAALAKTEKRREQKRFKGAEVRKKVVGALFGGGRFE